MDLATLAPLAQVLDVRLYSLQVGGGAEQVRHPHGLSLVHLGDMLTDWATTASVMAEIDVVVTVDTGAAHLAGAMGAPRLAALAESS